MKNNKIRPKGTPSFAQRGRPFLGEKFALLGKNF